LSRKKLRDTTKKVFKAIVKKRKWKALALKEIQKYIKLNAAILN